jgi:mono/diheme cytochrome c family protein
MTDQAIADLSTYIRNEWANTAAPVTPVLVAKQRELNKHRADRPWTAKELEK